MSRRSALRGGAAIVAGALASRTLSARSGAEHSTLTFPELPHGVDANLAVARGYRADVLIRWGDPLFGDTGPFDPLRLDADTQERRFGYNNDYVAYMPLGEDRTASDSGLLFINHEFTSTALMFPGLRENPGKAMSRPLAEVQMAAHGASVVEVRRDSKGWHYVADSRHNRRITARSTAMSITGPAAGHPRLRTAVDQQGVEVIGTLFNCAGGKTPWGTVLSAEEHFEFYFGGQVSSERERENYHRYQVTSDTRFGAWSRHFPRFDISKEPNEPNRFGWVVEIDPYDPHSKPKKRTALGRFYHEGATTVVSSDGRVALYSGDDRTFEYLYRFVTRDRFDPQRPEANVDLLDHGTLSVARLNEDGTLDWLPLIYGSGPLTKGNGFQSLADVLIETRRAADLLGATPMDRPEDVETSPVTGKVYASLTNNMLRRGDQVDVANPRGPNFFGSVLEMIPPGAGTGSVDHTAERYRWELPILCGDPRAQHGARYHEDVSRNGWFAAPDNLAFDDLGRLWIATDMGSLAERLGFADGMYACDVEGGAPFLSRHFLRTPRGAEMCGPEFTPDSETLFVAVQHPGAVAGSSFEAPATRWPDFKAGMPPRPAVVAITRRRGGRIGT